MESNSGSFLKKRICIVTDLDGTLLNSESEFPEKNKSTLQDFLNHDHIIIFATGRRFHSTSRYAAELKGNVYLVCNNGQVTGICGETKEIWDTNFLDSEMSRTASEIGKSRGLSPILHTGMFEEGIDMCMESGKGSEAYVHNNKDRIFFSESHHDFPFAKGLVLCFLSKDMDTLKSLDREITDSLSEHSFRTVLTTINRVGPCLEILPKETSKWSGVQSILKKIQSHDIPVISFGDESNDIELIENSHIGIAPSNAVEPVKKIADRVSHLSNNEEFIHYELEKILSSAALFR